MTILKHAGRMGDVFYSLYWATRAAHFEPFRIVLQTGVSAWDPSGRPHMMEEEDAAFMRPLLEAQGYIDGVSVVRKGEPLPTGCVELDAFRRNMSSVIRKEIRSWYYPHGPVLPGEWERKVLSALEKYDRTEKIAISFTPRYRQSYALDVLKKCREDLVFVGLPDEWRSFCSLYFPVEYHTVTDALDLLQFLQSCRGFIGNVSGVFALAECAKVRRILCVAQDGGNVRVFGDGFEARTPSELETFINQL